MIFFENEKVTINLHYNAFGYNVFFNWTNNSDKLEIVTTQLQPKTKLGWPHNWVEPTTTPPPPHHPTTTQTFKAVPGNPGSWFSVCNLMLTQLDELWKTTSIFLKMEDDLNLFPNGRWPQFCSRRPRELVFGMQHCSTQLDEIWKTASIFLKMEDYFNFF
jgi:hypothetical protein